MKGDGLVFVTGQKPFFYDVQMMINVAVELIGVEKGDSAAAELWYSRTLPVLNAFRDGMIIDVIHGHPDPVYFKAGPLLHVRREGRAEFLRSDFIADNLIIEKEHVSVVVEGSGHNAVIFYKLCDVSFAGCYCCGKLGIRIFACKASTVVEAGNRLCHADSFLML